MLEKSNIQTIDFGKLYKEQKSKTTFKIKSADDWDQKASSMSKRVFKSIYIEQFLSKVDMKGARTLLDVGCGPGTLGLSLAKNLEHVYCLDFSAKMLECVHENAQNANLNNITTMQKSFEENWDDVPKCDILIASRCMEVLDLETTLKKLSACAKKLYITYKVGGSFVDEEIINCLTRNVTPKPDYIYLVNILYGLGYTPKVDFIQSEGNRFQADSQEEFIQKVSWSLGEINKEEEKNLIHLYNTEYKTKNFKETPALWALISYDT